MTECNGCGGCCDPVQLPFTPLQLQEYGPGALEHVEDYEWVMTALTRIPYREGMAESPHLKEGGRTLVGIGLDQQMLLGAAFYRCKFYDREGRRCTAYEQRPPICSGYPWYGDRPDPDKAIPRECSFNEDVGRPVAVQIGRNR